MFFFKPTKPFLKWLIERAAGRTIVDVGCGEGLLLHRLIESGYTNVAGVEPFWHQGGAFILQSSLGKVPKINLPEGTVIAAEAANCALLSRPNLLVIFARPNHSGWVEDTIPSIHSTSEVLYISRPGNADMDLGSWLSLADKLRTPKAGADAEEVFHVHRGHRATKLKPARRASAARLQSAL